MKSITKWLLTGCLGTFLLTSIVLHGAESPQPSGFICPVLSNPSAGFSICSGDNTHNIAVLASSNAVDIRFVWFASPQTGTAMYSGGNLLGTVPAAAFTPEGIAYKAQLAGLTLPAATTFTPYYIYAILDSTDPDADAGCQPFAEIIVKVNPFSRSIICQNSVQVSLDSTGKAIVTPQNVLNNGAYPDYDIFTVNITLVSTGQSFGNTVTCANIGQNLRATVTYPCNGNNCSATLRVQDKLPPVIQCEDISVSCAVSNFAPAFLKNTLGIAAAVPEATDNCSAVTVTQTETWFDLGCNSSFNGFDNLSGYLRRRWVARDASGNTSTCTQYIYDFRRDVMDVLLPPDTTLFCPAPSTAPSSTGVPYLEEFGHVFPLMPNTSYCELNAVYADQIIPVCDGTYKILRKWTLYSWCRPISTDPLTPNPRYHTQIIVVKDKDGPTATCPEDLTVNTNQNTCCATVNLPDILLSDACSRVSSAVATVSILDLETEEVVSTMTFNGTLSDFPENNMQSTDTMAVFGNSTCLPVGVHEVYYVFSDDCGNQSDCLFYVFVDDGVPPVAVCDGFTEVSLGADSLDVTMISAKSLDNGSYDNCSPTLWYKAYRAEENDCYDTVADDFVPFCCSDIGDTIMVGFRVYDIEVDSGGYDINDEYGHYNDCMVRVLVSDKLPPYCSPPPHITVSCENFDPSLTTYGTAVWSDNCCVEGGEVSLNTTQFDTVCNRGTLIRTFSAADCAGNTAACTQRIVVEYYQDYYIKMPDDVTVPACNGSADYGKPVFFGQDCELLAASFQDDTFTLTPDACIKIERHWKIINWCTYNPNLPCIAVPNPTPNANPGSLLNLIGPVVSPPGTLAPWTASNLKINPTDAAPVNFSSFWRVDANCYTYRQIIKITDLQPPEVDSCPTEIQRICDLTPNDNGLWHESYWWNPETSSHDLCEGPTDLKVTAADACTGADVNIRYLLFLDLNHDGTLETVVNSSNLPPVNTIYYGNALNPNFTGGEPRTFDQRNLPLGLQFRFTIQTTVANGKKTAALRFNTTQSPNTYLIPELPYGRHKIKWIITDGCGNEQVCEYYFTVQDCKKPTIVCKPISTNIMQNGMVTLWASDFLQYAEDNCTPPNRLAFGVVKEGDSNESFPLDTLGNPRSNVTFDCNELGTQIVQLWARDLNGNTDFCAAYVQVQDNLGNCIGRASVAGAIQTEIIEGVEEARVTLQGSHPALPPLTYYQDSDNSGLFRFNNALPIGSNYTLTPVKTDNPLNGVTTLDISLISKHILDIEPLASVYKMIAADANKSGTITTLDIVELRRLILGISDDFSSNNSWRFVPRSFVFPNPKDPFSTGFPESHLVSNLQNAQLDRDFVGIKTGDVNDTAVPNPFAGHGAEDRSKETLFLDIYTAGKSQHVADGQELTLHLSTAEAIAGCQMTLQFTDLEILSITPGTEMRADHFAMHKNRNALTVSWNIDGKKMQKPTFSLLVRAKKAGDLTKMLRISNTITPTESYLRSPEAPVIGDIALRFRSEDGQGSITTGLGFEIYQNYPNPFARRTIAGFYLPEAGHVTLRIYDATGSTVHVREGDFQAGYGYFIVERPGANGTLYYRIESKNGTGEGKMIRMEE